MGEGQRFAPRATEQTARRHLELREVRLERVVAALRSQAGRYEPRAPTSLRSAIDDYQADLAAVRRLLAS
jgi:hypothetical protein